MLPKINRLKSESDFKRVFSNGKISENQFIKIKFAENNKNHTRFGFVISTKFAKKAVTRNLVKRRLRAVSCFLLKNIKKGFDIVVWPKKMSEKSDYSILLDNLKNLLTKNDLLSI